MDIPTNRIKILRVNPMVFAREWQNGKAYRVTKGLPEGSIFRGFAHDYQYNCINVFIEHDSFPLVDEGTCPGEITIEMRTLYENEEGKYE